MHILKSILAFIGCTPIWIILFWLATAALEWIWNLYERYKDESLLLSFILGTLAIVSHFVILFVLIGLGVGTWCVAEILLDL